MADVVINIGAVSEITAGTGLTGGTITGTGTIAASFGTSAGTICQGNDSRLTNGRTPTTHAATHATGGGDPVTLDQSQITDLTTDLAEKVADTRQVIAGTGMSGGGALSADVTLNVSYGMSGSTACVGNDARLSNARTPTTHASTHSAGQSDAITITQAQVTSLVSDLALKASTTHAATHATGGTDVLTLGQAQITGLVSSLAAKALGATTMTAGTGLTGGGDLSANRSFAVDFGATSTTATVGNDSRLSFLAAGSGASTRTLQNKLRDVVSVKDFGATGDGTTDDTLAIQSALNSGVGKYVYLPPGTYKTTSVLSLSSNTYLYGASVNSVIAIQPTASASTANNCFSFDGDDITVDNIKVLGTNEGILVSGNYTGFAIAFSIVGRTRPTIKNCTVEKFASSIVCTASPSANSNSITITGNRIYGGLQLGDASLGSDAQDIVIAGSTTGTYPNLVGRRSIIANNYCLGNVDTGINVAGNGGDTDFIITGNIVQPLDLDGITPLASGSNKSRYGIITGYGGLYPARIVVSNNVIRDSGEAGIVCESQSRGGGTINITANIISNVGFSVLYPVDYSLKAGINVSSGGGDVISDNIITDCYRVGIQILQNFDFLSGANNSNPVISGNNISNIAGDPNFPTYPALGYGIYVAGSYVRGVLIANNRITRTSARAIMVSCQSGATNGNVLVTGNLIDNNQAAAAEDAGIVVLNNGGLDCTVSDNKLNGSTVTNTGSNRGIWILGTQPTHTIGNVVNKYFHGIYCDATPGRNLAHQCDGNVLTNCSYAIELHNSPANAGPWLVSNNVFKTCTFTLAGGIWQGTSFYKGNTTGLILVSNSVAPTTGTWVVGDRVTNTAPAVSSPKGWICTVAGTPGTWVSEGNL